MVFCPSLSCLSLFFSPPWSSFSSRVFAFWQSSKRLNCCSTRYHIVLRNLSFSSPFSKTFLLPFYRVSGPAVCRGCIDHVPRFRTNCSAELSKRLRVFSSIRFRSTLLSPCYWLTREIREENAKDKNREIIDDDRNFIKMKIIFNQDYRIFEILI